MSSFTLFFFFLSLSLHACNARHHLGFHKLNQLHFPTKIDIVDDSVSRAVRPENRKKQQQGQGIGNSETKLLENGAAANMLQKLLVAILGSKETTTITFSGHEISVSSRDYFDDQAHKKELKRRPARSMLGSPEPEGDGEESVDSAENDTVEDIIVMDYAQPHRKPPIHNEKP